VLLLRYPGIINLFYYDTKLKVLEQIRLINLLVCLSSAFVEVAAETLTELFQTGTIAGKYKI